MKEQTTGVLAPVISLLQQRESSERGSLTLREVIDGYMAGYDGRDPTRNARVSFWSASVGDVCLRDLDSDLIGDALERIDPLLTLAGLNWLTQSSRSRLCLVKSAGTGKRDSAGRVM